MSSKMLLTARLDQRLVMSQQLTRAITLLQYTTMDLKQLVLQYIETNPLIEMEDAAAQESEDNDIMEPASYTVNANRISRYNNEHSVDDNVLENYTHPVSLRHHLLDQTLYCKFSQLEQLVAEAIIDAIDESGYLSMSVEEIRQALDRADLPDTSLIESVLARIQAFDPPGIACRDIRECLILQLQAGVMNETRQHALAILRDHYDLLTARKGKSIMRKINISQDEYNDAIELIRCLNTKPALQFGDELNLNIEPELYVRKVRDEWRVFLSESILTRLKINQQYHEAIKRNKKHASYEVLSRELQEAQWLLKGLQRRNETLLKVAEHIVRLQHDFIEQGNAFMRPMNINDVSEALGMHESTVSRVTTGKYISTPRGVFELKFFFPSYVHTESGATCSDTAVKELIREIIAGETQSRVYNDGELAALLKEKGINIARRTVAKYREALKILPSYLRAQKFAFD